MISAWGDIIRAMQKRIWITVLSALLVCMLLVVALYQLPPVYNWLSWRLSAVSAQIRYALNPPGEAVFIPQEQGLLGTNTPGPTLTLESPLALTPTFSPTLPDLTATPTSTPWPASTPTSTATPAPLPEKVLLTGVVHEYQQMNNCGPATLSMALSYWGWQGDQRDTRAYLRPNFSEYDDKNVSPFEMVTYVETQTDLRALARVGGRIDTLKRLVAAGFPVIIEKGFQPPKEDWMGHYELVTGYDDTRERFITQDSYIMPDFPLPYEELDLHWWRDFNHVYVVIYPPEREPHVLEILGPHVDALSSYQLAAQNALAETGQLSGRDLFFAWYNLGSSQLAMADYGRAAQAYDQAFSIYAGLEEGERPWRMLWYQVGPYEAYFRTGRYQDVISLVNQTLSFLGPPVLEESLYWRGLAKEALGDMEGAYADLKKAAQINPTSTDVLAQLERLGVDYP